MSELTAPIVLKNNDKQLVFGPVLVPEEPDTDGDTVSAEQIESVAHKFVEDYGNIDLMHSLNNVGKLVESYIAPVEMEADNGEVVPKGSWMMGVRVTDDNTWQSVKNGKLGGFSVMALENKTAEKSSQSVKDSKRVTLEDLGDDWIVNAVSLVEQPAVPKAKWTAVKSKAPEMDETAQKAIDGSLEHRKRLIDDKLESQFMSFDKFPIIHSTLENSVIFILMDDATGTKTTYQVGYQLTDNGDVEFTEQPQEVRIEENVVSKGKQQQEGVMSKFMRSIGLKEDTTEYSEKAGKTISEANLKKLRQAKEVIDDLLETGEQERKNKSGKEDDNNMEVSKEELQTMINESVKQAMGTDQSGQEDQSTKGQDDQDQDQGQDQGEQATKGQGEQSGEQAGEQGGEQSTKSQDEDYKEKYEAAMKQLDQIKKIPLSNRISGQDGSAEKGQQEEEQDGEERNAFGFKRRK